MNLKQEWDSIEAAEADVDERKWRFAKRLVDSAKSTRVLATETGRSQATVSRWMRVYRERESARGLSFNQALDQVRGDGTEAETERKRRSHATSVLRDPALRREVINSLDSADIEALADEATDRLVGDARARRAEHDTDPTVRDLTDGEKFDPAEYWADTLVIRVNRNARELDHLIKRAGGLLFGTMPPSEAFDYLHEAERLIAEARAAAQEQDRDRRDPVEV